MVSLGEKMDGQPIRILLILYEQRKARMHMKMKSSDEPSCWIWGSLQTKTYWWERWPVSYKEEPCNAMAYGVLYKKDFPNILVIYVQEKVEHLDVFRTFLDIALILLSKEEKSHHGPLLKWVKWVIIQVLNNVQLTVCLLHSVNYLVIISPVP